MRAVPRERPGSGASEEAPSASEDASSTSSGAPSRSRARFAAETNNNAVARDAGTPSVPAPPLTVLADDHFGPAHAAAKRWIVFSDLHVSRRTAPVAMEVLRAVHDEAEARSAGVVFLGDFWHARGAIPVEPLIDALEIFRAWRVPTVMIPGNHDQVTAGGETHALAPLRAANPAMIAIVSSPAAWRGALWLPYRRDPATLRDAVNHAATLRGAHSISAIMCHADVRGASMNETFQARDGIDPDVFRLASSGEGGGGEGEGGGEGDSNSPRVFTGHYHKPHTVPGTRITYVGSPYQVSRAEAGQTKALIVLDAEAGWRGDEGAAAFAGDAEESSTRRRRLSPGGDPAITDVPQGAMLTMDLGPRHFDVRGEDAKAPPGARAGDVVRWTLPLSAAELPGGGGGAASEAIERARAAGIGVEVTYERQAAPARIPEAEELGVSGLYDAYAEATALDAAAVKVGKEILAEVAAATRSADADGTSRRSAGGGGVLGSDRGPLRVAFESVEVEGFGAFADSARYPLGDRGVCAVVGDNRDDRCSDSNGAGKTTLVMAPMWALTGESDARVDQGGSKRLTKTDVVNDSRRTARVRVDGSVSGLPFWVERKVSRTKLVSLRYGIGDEEKTLADARLTQAALDRDLGAAVIARACFHGQHTVTALLDANDAALKAALGELVEAETWAEAKDLSRRVVSEKRKTVATLEADVETRAAYVRRVQARLDEATRARDEWEAAERSNAAKLEREKDAALSRVAEALAACRRDAEALRSASERWDEEERRVAAEAERRDREVWDRSGSGSGGVGVGPGADLADSDPELAANEKAAALEANAESARLALVDAQRREASARARASNAHAAVGAFQGVGMGLSPVCGDDGDGDPSEETRKNPGGHAVGSSPLGVCDRCRQPIDPTRHRDTLAALVADAERTREAHAAESSALREAHRRAEAASAAVRRHAAEAASARVRRRREEQALANAARAANERLAEMRARRVNAHVVYAALARAEALLTGAHAEMVPERRPERHGSPPEGEFSDAALLSLENGRALVDAAETSAALCERFVRELASRSSALVEAEAVRAVNPRDAEVATLASQAESESASLEAKLSALEAKREELATARRADAAFGTRGIQSYLFEGALSELSSRVGAYMEALTGGALTMELRPAGANESGSSVGPGDDSGGSVGQHSGGSDETLVSRADASKTRSTASSTSSSAEKIERVIHAQSALGAPTRRSLRQLSGGERRRAAIALALAHADLALARGGVACDLLVLDEVLQHLDGEGAARVAALLRSLPRATVLLTSQADSATAHLFDVVDRVWKAKGSGGVVAGEAARRLSYEGGEGMTEEEEEATRVEA